MTIDRLGFLQDRMARAYQEQVWAAAIVVGANAFVVGQAKLISTILHHSTVILSLLLICFLGLIFVWSRHAVYNHYDNLLRKLISEDPGDAMFFKLNRSGQIYRHIAGWSGVVLYSIILLATTWVSIIVAVNTSVISN